MTRRQQLLDFAILGLLHDAPMHGYELRKHLNLTMGVFRALSYGTLYPALRGLVAGGSITESTDAGAVTAASRRPRIVYELTDRGAARFDELAKQTDPTVYEDELFELRMAFFGRTDAAVRLRILEGRRSRLEQRLADLRSGTTTGRQDSWTTALQQHGEEATEREVRWLSELIEAEHHPRTRPA